jgi:AcrR family transcriptional regulator
MRSVPASSPASPSPRASDDATTRARIRDAAISLFGREGFRETTVRRIAEAAGVSAALIIHHFGSKDGLRLACDEYILGEVTAQGDTIGNGSGPGTSGAIQRWLAEIDDKRPWLNYIARALTEGGALGDRLFDDFVDYTEGMFAAGVADGSVLPSKDPRMRAVMLTAYGLSALVFERQIGRSIGQPGLTSETAARMSIPALELFTTGVYTSDALLRAAESAVAAERAVAAASTPEGERK